MPNDKPQSVKDNEARVKQEMRELLAKYSPEIKDKADNLLVDKEISKLYADCLDIILLGRRCMEAVVKVFPWVEEEGTEKDYHEFHGDPAPSGRVMHESGRRI